MTAWASYLAAPIERSEQFAERVAAVGQRLSAVLGIPVHHDADMNYRAGQLLTAYIGPDGAPVAADEGAGTMLRVAVSSRGPLWTLMAWRQDTPRRGSPTAVPAGDPVPMIAAVLADAGLQQVPPDRLDDPVPGHETDLDGAPATLRDVLFCEVC
jgi:hypothetical protein